MARGLNNGIANALAILLVVAMMGSPAHTDDGGVSLPQTEAEPVVMLLSERTPDQANPSELLQVFVGAENPCCEGRTPIAGRYALTDKTLTFSPAFGFDLGQDYVVRVWTRQSEYRLFQFRVPLETAPAPAAVTEIYPSGDVLPENVLRFYVHFSTPMSPHVAFDYIKLRDATGNADEAAFMKFKQELWNEDRTRLTVLIDPGRIKREVATNLELGPALLAGNEYTLSIEGGWPSADGTSVLPGFSRTFNVSEALRERPDANSWEVLSPCMDTTEPLHINFDRPFDRHLLTRDIHVADGEGGAIEGIIKVGEGESSWSFTPNEPWFHEKLQVAASTELEDVAGNNFHDLLDHVRNDETSSVSSTSLSINLKSCSG